MAKLSVCLAVAVALGLTFCGSADAFVVVAPVGASTPVVRASMPTPGGMMAGGKSCSSGAFPTSFSSYYGFNINSGPSAESVRGKFLSPSSTSPTMRRSSLLMATPFVDGSENPSTSRRASWGRGVAPGYGVKRECRDGMVENEGNVRRGSKALLRAFQPLSAVRFVRDYVKRRAVQTGKGMASRVAAWRRGMSVAFIGMAAAFVVMSASARPASASDAAQIADAAPKMIRLTNMPEEVYRHREELEEFCQSKREDRLFDFNDLTVYEEELSKLDMFGTKVAVTYGAKESMRLKYTSYLKDIGKGGRHRGIKGGSRLVVFSSILLVVVGGVLSFMAWVAQSFISMAKEEEVHLYGEEISVDATEKPSDELEDDYDIDDEDMEDFAKAGTPPPGDGPVPSPPSPPSDGDGGAGDGGAGDDLLGT